MIDTDDKTIDDHWKYIEAVLNMHNVPQSMVKVVEFHYKSAFRHGMKHAREEKRR
jgi:hypothetical protein